MRESDVEKYLVERVKEQGGEVRKLKWIGRNKAPDRLVLLPPKANGFARVIWVELKAPGKAATFPADAHERGQEREHTRMRAMGLRVEVADSFESVEAILQ